MIEKMASLTVSPLSEIKFQLHDNYEKYMDFSEHFSQLYPESPKISCDLFSYYVKELDINFE